MPVDEVSDLADGGRSSATPQFADRLPPESSSSVTASQPVASGQSIMDITGQGAEAQPSESSHEGIFMWLSVTFYLLKELNLMLEA